MWHSQNGDKKIKPMSFSCKHKPKAKKGTIPLISFTPWQTKIHTN